jgi:hypothetical protein
LEGLNDIISNLKAILLIGLGFHFSSVGFCFRRIAGNPYAGQNKE